MSETKGTKDVLSKVSIILKDNPHLKPIVKTNLKHEEVRQLAGINIHTTLEVVQIAEALMTTFRVMAFDKSFILPQPYKRLLLEMFLKGKQVCHQTLVNIEVQGGILLRSKDGVTPPIQELIKKSGSLEKVVENLGGNPNKPLESLEIYERPVEFLADYLIEFFNTYREKAKTLTEKEHIFLEGIKNLLQKFYKTPSKEEAEKVEEIFEAIAKLLQ